MRPVERSQANGRDSRDRGQTLKPAGGGSFHDHKIWIDHESLAVLGHEVRDSRTHAVVLTEVDWATAFDALVEDRDFDVK